MDYCGEGGGVVYRPPSQIIGGGEGPGPPLPMPMAMKRKSPYFSIWKQVFDCLMMFSSVVYIFALGTPHI